MTEPSIPPIDDLELPDGDETRPNRVDSGRGQYRTIRGMTPRPSRSERKPRTSGDEPQKSTADATPQVTRPQSSWG